MDYWELTTCWNYFLSLDRDLNETARYIEPESQENTFSFEFYKIIMLGLRAGLKDRYSGGMLIKI